MAEPKSLKDWRNKRVVLQYDIINRAGQAMSAGETVVIRRARRDGTFDLARLPCAIDSVERHAFRLLSV